MTSRGVEPMEESARTSSSTVAPCWRTRLRVFSSLIPTPTWGTTSVVPEDNACGWETEKRGLHFDREIPVHDGDRRDSHFLAHDDRARPLIDHDAGLAVGLDSQLLELGEEFHGSRGILLGDVDRHQRRVLGLGDLRIRSAETQVHRFRNPRRGREIRLVQEEFQLLAVQFRGGFALDQGPFRDTAHGGMVDSLLVAGLPGHESAGDHGPLRHGIHLAVRAFQAGEEQQPALQVVASPMAATVTSIRAPGRANGGSVAVIMAAAVFLTWMADGDTDTPILSNRFVRL